MTVQVRLNRGKTHSPRARRAGGEDHRTGATPANSGARQRHGGPSEDRALYTCACGYVFEAQVSTSVGCPHCGGQQAW